MRDSVDAKRRMCRVLFLAAAIACLIFAGTWKPAGAWADDLANTAATTTSATDTPVLAATSASTATATQTSTANTAATSTANSSSTTANTSNAASTGSAKADTATTATGTTSTTSTSQQVATGTSTASGSAATIAPNNQQSLVDGTYAIESAKNLSKVVDVAGGSKRDGGNVQIYDSNMTPAQQWKVTYNASSGYYSIINVNSGKSLDVDSARAKDGENVQIYTANGTKAQLWDIVKMADGSYKIISALNPNFVLDIAGGSTSNGGNIQIYTSNNTAAQRFFFLNCNPAVVGVKSVEDGCYTVVLKNSPTSSLDIPGSSQSNAANVQLYASNNTPAQKFYFTYDGSGFYRIVNVASGKSLDVDGANLVPGTNVQQYDSNSTPAQKWAVMLSADGTYYTLISKANGLVLDAAGGSAKNGTNVQTYASNNTPAQRWSLLSTQLVNEGIATIRTRLDTGKSLDVPAGSTANGTQLQIYDYNGTFAQKYLLAKSTNDSYTIQVANSGQYLTASDGKVVQDYKSSADTQLWIPVWSGSGIMFKNVATGTVVEIASKANGALANLAIQASSLAQSFTILPTPIIDDGMYTIISAIGSKVLDVAGGSTANNANVDIWTSNNTNAQKFYINPIGDYFRIINAKAHKAVEVSGGSTADAANVRQYTYNATEAQLWKVVITDNYGVSFVNVKSGKALDVVGGVNSNGTNVDIYAKNDTQAQRWSISPTTYTPEDSVLDRAKARANGLASSTGYLILVDLSAHKVIVFTGHRGAWNVAQYWDCTNGAPATPTVVGDYAIGSRGYSFGSGYTCYYWTQFCGNYLFHSVLYYEGTRNIMDGRLGQALSHGCVRLAIDNAYWINTVVPSDTRVQTYY